MKKSAASRKVRKEKRTLFTVAVGRSKVDYQEPGLSKPTFQHPTNYIASR